ncbi:hypothetical protein ACO0LM_15585 [Undibacterium sp. Di26W]|uniref:hypothetical protein n=1 Tax=Undibacterium sp. Di26W TaxID=3413035 RepID=UPI003BF208BB
MKQGIYTLVMPGLLALVCQRFFICISNNMLAEIKHSTGESDIHIEQIHLLWWQQSAVVCCNPLEMQQRPAYAYLN